MRPLKAYLTEAPGGRWNVGIIGTVRGQFFNRPRWLIRGPWSRATAERKRRKLQAEIDAGRCSAGILPYA